MTSEITWTRTPEDQKPKKKVSRFEFAVMQALEDYCVDAFEPFTEEEETQMRAESIVEQAKRLQIRNI